MNPKYLLLVFLFCATKLFSQEKTLNFTLTSTTITCDSILKEIALYQQLGDSDSLILRTETSSCYPKLTFESKPGNYVVKIRTALFPPLELVFTLSDDSPDLIDLGTFALKENVSVLDEVTITGIQRRFIQVDADKTTITVQDNPILSVSSVYDAILKIPGVVPYPGGGFAVSGQLASVYFEGIPSSLSTNDLTNLLKSLPATSVQNIEIISNPGASYDANVSGAILNINSVGKVTKWLSGTISMNYGLNQNNKTTPSLVMSGRRKLFTWQFQAGHSYYEASNKSTYNQFYTSFSPTANLYSERNTKYRNNYSYFKPSLNFKLNKKSFVVLNYTISKNFPTSNGTSFTNSNGISPGVDLRNNFQSKSSGLYNEVSALYKINLDTLKRTFSVTAYYSNYGSNSLSKTSQQEFGQRNYNLLKSESVQNRAYFKADLELPFSKLKFYVNTGVKYSYLGFDRLGSYNFQNPSEDIFVNPSYNSEISFNYQEDNAAAYLDLKKALGKKVTVGAGVRVESFTLKQKSNVTVAGTKNYFNVFPSFNAIYRLSPDINLVGTYSRKIGVPGYNQFDPNNTGYYDTYSSSSGNTNLDANFYDNAEVKFTIFDYLQISAHYTNSATLNLNEVRVEPNSLQSVQTFKTYNNVSSMSYFFALPVPFGLFKEGLKFFEGNIDVDKINFLYLYTEIDQTKIKGYNYINGNKALVTYGVYSQFILPGKIRLNVDYYITSKGNYQIYNFTKPRSALEFVFSREFFDKKWRASLSFEDVFNTNQNSTRLAYTNLNLDSYSKDDTRIIWMKLSYSFGRYEKPQGEDGGLPNKPNVGM